MKMKTCLLTITYFLVAITDSANASEFLDLGNTLKAHELKGQVKSIVHDNSEGSLEHINFNKKGLVTEYKILQYDPYSKKKYKKSELAGHVRHYIYDEDDRLIEYKKQPINTTKKMSNGVTYYYDEKQQYPHMAVENGVSRSSVTKLFYKNGLLIREVIAHQYSDKLLPEVIRYKYNYDHNERLESVLRQDISFLDRQVNKRNEQGLIIEASFKLLNSNHSEEVRFIYKYLNIDDKGNWINRDFFRSDSNEIVRQKRQITYYQ